MLELDRTRTSMAGKSSFARYRISVNSCVQETASDGLSVSHLLLPRFGLAAAACRII
jgi:hypothetical protein